MRVLTNSQVETARRTVVGMTVALERVDATTDMLALSSRTRPVFGTACCPRNTQLKGIARDLPSS